MLGLWHHRQAVADDRVLEARVQLRLGLKFLFGIAIVPVQLTSLADTVLKTQRAREAKAVAKPRGIRLDRLTRACSNCSEKAHRKDANFCWQCGVPLPDAEPLPDD